MIELRLGQQRVFDNAGEYNHIITPHRWGKTTLLLYAADSAARAGECCWLWVSPTYQRSAYALSLFVGMIKNGWFGGADFIKEAKMKSVHYHNGSEIHFLHPDVTFPKPTCDNVVLSADDLSILDAYQKNTNYHDLHSPSQYWETETPHAFRGMDNRLFVFVDNIGVKGSGRN